MVCPHCKNKVRSISYMCPICGGYLYDKPAQTEQEYIHSRLLKFGLNKYKDKQDILEKEILEEDKLFLKLKTMEMIQEQESHLRTIKNILVFFTVVAVIAIAFSIFISVKTAKEASSYSSLYFYEQSVKTDKKL